MRYGCDRRRHRPAVGKQHSAKALVTLVRMEGSSYRRPGAHLLIGADGEYAGTISGGCLEAEVVRRAAWMVRDGAVVERYSTLFDDTAEIPFGLGCGGIVDLLLEPAETPECRALIWSDGSFALRRGVARGNLAAAERKAPRASHLRRRWQR